MNEQNDVLYSEALLTVEEASTYLHVSKSFLQHLAANRKIAFTRLGRRSYFRPEDLDRYISSQRVEPVGACKS